MRKTLKKVAASALAAAFALTVVAGVGNVAKAAPKVAPFDPAADYYATIGFQQNTSWIFHNEVTDPDGLGLDGKKVKEAGLEYRTDVMKSGDNGLEKMDGTVTGADLKGNGTYTVKVEGLNGIMQSNDSETKMNMIYLSTNIPADAKDKVTFSDVSFKIDGNSVQLPSEQFFKTETLESGYMSLYLVDSYAKDQGEYEGSPDVMNPNDSMEITFTIAGFTKDNPDAVAATPTPEPKADDSDTSSDTEDDADEEEGSSVNPVVVGGIVAAVVVVAGVAVVVSKKKK